MTDINEIRAALAAATPGPWSICSDAVWADSACDFVVNATDNGKPYGMHSAVLVLEATDQALIASSPTWLAELCDRVEAAEAERDDMRTARNIAEARAKDAEAKLADANRLRSEAISTFKAREDAIERAEKRAATAEMERDARADDAKLGAAVRAVLDMFMWDHSTVRAEVESDRLAETVEGCIFVAIERAIRPADFVPAHAKGGE